jgi:cytoskeleton protein RodZ
VTGRETEQVREVEPEPEPESEPEPQRRPERVARAAPEEPAAAEVIAGGVRTVRIDLSFEQDSWVEIYDARDARLMYAMGRAGSSRSVEGEPPLRVFLGYAGGVTVRVDGKPFELTGANRRGDTARFIVRAVEDGGR